MFRFWVIFLFLLSIPLYAGDICWQLETDGKYHAYVSDGRGDIGNGKRKAVGWEPRVFIGEKAI